MMKKLGIFLASLLITTHALAIETLIRIPLDSTSVVLPCITLLDISASPEGAVAATGITNATSGLQIKVRADVTNGWHAEHTTATINAITGTIGKFEVPDANDVHFEEVATSAGCYQLILPDSYYTLDDGGTDCNSGPCDAKDLTVLIRDTSSPTFADKWFKIALNVTSADDLVDKIWNEPSSGHTTAGTAGDSQYIDIPAIASDTDAAIPAQLTIIAASASRNFLYTADIDAVTSQTAFQVDAADDPGGDDYHIGRWLCVEDADDELNQDCSRVTDFVASTDEWTIAGALDFTVAIGDTIFIKAPSSMKLVADEIDATIIAANSIGSSELAGDAITAGIIAADAIGASELAASAIGASEIAANAIGASEIAADAIGSSELATTAVEEIRDSLLAATIDGTVTLKCALALATAYDSGKWTRSGNVVTYRDPADSANRIVGTIDSNVSFDTITLTCP